MRSISWMVVSLALVIPVPGAAQVSVEVGPLLGYYRPLGSFEDASVYSTALPRTPQDLSGHAWGGEARVWFGKRVGTELHTSVARSTIPQVNTPAGPRGPTPAQVTTLTVQALLTVTGAPARDQIWISAGMGAIRHGGSAYDRYSAPTDLGPIVGAGARFGLTRQLHATVGFSTLVYMFDLPMPPELRLNPGSLERGRQVDLLVHLGVGWTVGGM
jgi:hypothetical protein